MSVGPITQLSDIVEPVSFAAYLQQITEQKSRIIQSGMLARNAALDAFLAGGGLTINVPSFRDLDDDPDNVSGQDAADIQRATAADAFPAPATDATPYKIEADTEVAVRLNRNNHWSSADLAAALAGVDPMDAIGNRVGDYWVRRLQDIFVATVQGISKDNGVNNAGDYSNDIAAAAYAAGVTDFSAEAFLDATLTMGDSMEDTTGVMVHSVVYNRMQKNNLIDFIPDARGEVQIPTFLGRQVIVDDRLPSGANVVRGDGTAGAAGMYETWLFGQGALQLGVGAPKVPVAVTREELAGNGGGQEILHNRHEWVIHPTGHAYVGPTAVKGGPSNAILNADTSWSRVYGERKMIKFARLITREA